MILKGTTYSLIIVLAGNISTNQLHISLTYKDGIFKHKDDGIVLTQTNNTSPVNVLSGTNTLSRQITGINIFNNDTVSATVTVKLDVSGTETILYKGVVGVNDVISWTAEGGWKNTSNNVTPLLNNKKVLTGALYETFDRDLCAEVNTAALSSGRLSLQAIWLPAGTTINSISFWSATTAGATLTNQLFGLYDINLNLLRSSTNDTSTAWAANSRKTLSLTSAFTTTYSGLHYLGIMVAATTVPTLKGNTAKTGGQLNAGAPSMGGTSTTGLTTALPATANAPATVTTSIWGCVN